MWPVGLSWAWERRPCPAWIPGWSPGRAGVSWGEGQGGREVSREEAGTLPSPQLGPQEFLPSLLPEGLAFSLHGLRKACGLSPHLLGRLFLVPFHH